MAEVDLGKVVPIAKGEWDEDESYERLDLVRGSDGKTFIAKTDVPAGTALEEGTYWQQIFSNLEIGTVSTVSADTGASASIGGTATDPLLNLSIPRGVAGNESIDDSKGLGDDDYVWSADKNVKTIKEYLHMEEITGWVSGYYINTSGTTANINSPVASASYSYVVVDCQYGDLFTISGQGGSSQRVYAFIDNSGNVLTKVGSNATVDGALAIAPVNAAKLVINNKQAGVKSYKGAVLNNGVVLGLNSLIRGTGSIDDATKTGVYWAPSSSSYTELPPELAGKAFILYVYEFPSATVQIAVTLDGAFNCLRFMTSNTWSSWRSNMGYLPITVGTAASTYSNLAENIPNFKMSYVNVDWFNDMASIGSNLVGWLFTYGFTFESLLGKLQVFVTRYNDIYIRSHYSSGSSVWTEWQMIGAKTSDAINMTAAYLPSQDLDDVTDNGLYWRSGPQSMLNTPEGKTGYFDLYVTKGSNVISQYCYMNGDAIYYRNKIADGDWSAWKLMTSNHVIGRVLYSFGDSTTKGQIGGASGTSNYNYPNLIGKLLNMTVNNMGVGGQGLIKNWDYIQQTYIDELDMSDANLITVGWAYNDSAYFGSMNFGEYTDTEAGSYVGYYYTIMKQFQEKCPSAQLVLVTGYGASGGKAGPPVVKATLKRQFIEDYDFADKTLTIGEMYDELEKMCNLHGWCCVNQHHGCALNEFNADLLIGDQIHPTNAGYRVYGNQIAARVATFYANV